MKNMERNISKLVDRFIKESFVDITNMNTDDAFNEVTETLHGNQKKIDVAESKGKITGADFKKLRSMKKHKEMKEIDYTDINDYDDIQGGYYNPNREKYDRFSKRYPGVVMSHGDYDKSDEELDAEYAKIMGKKEPKKTDYDVDFNEVVFEGGETEEGNAFGKAVRDAKKAGKKSFELDGETYDVKESVNKKIERILERRRGKKVSKDNKVVFTESQLIEFIEKIVETETKEDKVTTKSLKDSKSVNDKAISDTVSKMKEYMKNMGMEYQEDGKEFPKGNKAMSREDYGKSITDETKKAYKASKEIEEYVEEFTAADLGNLDYDNIKPNENWMTDNIEGSSRTGNSQEYANAIPTDVNKKVNDRRKRNLLAVLKRQAYNKAPQPTHSDESGEIVPTNIGGKKNREVNRIMHTESIEEKKVINDMEKMKKLINYNNKTQ